MKKTQEQKMQEKLYKLQSIEAHISYLQNLVDKYEHQIERLIEKSNVGERNHEILLGNLDSIKKNMSGAKSRFYDGAIEYWKADNADKEKRALTKFKSSKRKYVNLKREGIEVREQYNKNFERSSKIDSIICNRKSSIALLKLEITFLSLRAQSLENSLKQYIGEDILTNVLLNPEETPQPTYSPVSTIKKRVK